MLDISVPREQERGSKSRNTNSLPVCKDGTHQFHGMQMTRTLGPGAARSCTQQPPAGTGSEERLRDAGGSGGPAGTARFRP